MPLSIHHLLWFKCCCTPTLCRILWTRCILPIDLLLVGLVGIRFGSSSYTCLAGGSLGLVIVFCPLSLWRSSLCMVPCLVWSCLFVSVLLWISQFPWFHPREVWAVFLLGILGHSVAVRLHDPRLFFLVVIGIVVCWTLLHDGGIPLVLWSSPHPLVCLDGWWFYTGSIFLFELVRECFRFWGQRLLFVC